MQSAFIIIESMGYFFEGNGDFYLSEKNLMITLPSDPLKPNPLGSLLGSALIPSRGESLKIPYKSIKEISLVKRMNREYIKIVYNESKKMKDVFLSPYKGFFKKSDCQTVISKINKFLS